MKSCSAQLICTCSLVGRFQSNGSHVSTEHMCAGVCREAVALCTLLGGGVLRELGEWHESVEEEWEAGWSWTYCGVGGRMDEGEGERGSTDSITQLSAGVMLNWINLLWNVQVLPGLMPCVRWRLEKKREWLGRGCGNVMKRDLKRRIPPQGLSASFPATLSPLYYSVLTYSSTHASNIKNTRHIWKPMGSRMYRRHVQQRPSILW